MGILLVFYGCENTELNEVANVPIAHEENEIEKESINLEQNESMNTTDTVDKINSGIDAEEYLIQEVPELKKYEQHILKKSDNKAFLIIESNGELYEIEYEGVEKQYFKVYVGEKWEEHQVKWHWFYVGQNLDEILWYDTMELKAYSLSEWRESSGYNEMHNSLID